MNEIQSQILTTSFLLNLSDDWVKTDVGSYKLVNINYHQICSKESGCNWEESKEVCEKEGSYGQNCLIFSGPE